MKSVKCSSLTEAAFMTFLLVVIIYSVFCCVDKKPGRRETVLTREKKGENRKMLISVSQKCELDEN